MTTFNTGNPIGSTDARDRSDNSENLDLAVNSLSPTFTDRLGIERDTLEGIYQKSAYYRAGTFDAGYTLTNNRQTLAYGNIEYSWSGAFPKVVAAGSTPATSGGVGASAWVDRTDFTLRGELSSTNGAYLVKNSAFYIEDILSADVTNIPDKACVIARTRGGLASGGGIFHLSKTSAYTADNGLVFTPTIGTGQLIRFGYTTFGFNGKVSPSWYGATFDGSTDDYSSLQACITNNNDISLPAKTAIVSQKLTKSGRITLHGEGSGASLLFFTGSSTQGLSITQTLSTDTFDIKGVGFKTNAAPSAGFEGLKIDGASQITGTSGSYTLIGERGRSRGTINDVQFIGDDSSTTGIHAWAIGTHMQSVMNFSIRDYKYIGSFSLTDWAGVGILANGNGMFVDWSVSRIWTFFTAYSVLAPDYTEGMHIYDFELVNTKYGIYCGYVSGYSTLPSNLCSTLSAYIEQGHCAARLCPIFINGTNQSRFTDLLLYLASLPGDSYASGLSLVGSNACTIDNVTVIGDGAANTKTSNNGVVLSYSGYNKINNVFASYVGSSVFLTSSSQFNMIDGISGSKSTSVVSGDATSTQNDIGAKIRGTSLGGSKINLSNLDNRRHAISWATTIVQTLTATPSFTFTVTPPAGMFESTPLIATATAESKISGYSVHTVFNYDSSSASSLSFTVYPVDATNLSATAFRFGISAMG